MGKILYDFFFKFEGKYGDWKKVEFSKILEVQLHIVSFSHVGRLGNEEATL
jgi:hypothetical protein